MTQIGFNVVGSSDTSGHLTVKISCNIEGSYVQCVPKVRLKSICLLLGLESTL